MTTATTLGSAVDRAGRVLDAAGIPSPRFEARLILAHVLDAGVEAIIGYPERPLTPHQKQAFDRLVGRRRMRQPLAYLLGRREFWSLPIAVTRDTLIPRPESETVIETAIAHIEDRNRGLRILDLGTGSGCLLLALLSEFPAAIGLGVDRSSAALDVARRNAENLGFGERARWVCGDWAQSLAGQFDLIVANPPYVGEGDRDSLEPEIVRYEPHLALFGGVDGLESYRAIAPELSRLLAPNGHVILEIAAGQGKLVTAMLRHAGIQRIEIYSDLSDIPRCALGIRRQKPCAGKKWLETKRFPTRFSMMGGPGIAGCRAKGRR